MIFVGATKQAIGKLEGASFGTQEFLLRLSNSVCLFLATLWALCYLGRVDCRLLFFFRRLHLIAHTKKKKSGREAMNAVNSQKHTLSRHVCRFVIPCILSHTRRRREMQSSQLKRSELNNQLYGL